ncbi:unnamed protein product, partial [Effrenium voratum]
MPNVVHVGSQLPCVVDLLFDPGALYEDPSAKSQEPLGFRYRRLVADAAFTGKPPVPPSARTDLAGHMPRPPWHVEPWELEIQRARRVGRGGFGEVFQGRWDGVRVAVKEMKDNSPSHQEAEMLPLVMDFFLEIAILSQLNHPNIVRFWRGSVELHGQTRSLLMVTEYIKQGGLSRLLHGHGGPALPDPLTLAQALSFALDVARGVQYLHSNRILHLDLKSPNVLCAPVWTAKLCDFGLAKMKGEATYVQSTLQGVSPVWAPPEMFDQKEGLTEKADVYSFAIIFFELLTKRVPFAEISAAQLPAVKAANQLAIPSGVPADCAELIRQCCVASPAARPSMSGAQARVREIAQSHDISLLEVKPPAALLCFDDDQQRRVQDAEDEAARRLVEVDRQRAHLRNELAELHKKIEASRRRSAELSSRAESEGAEAENSEAWCEPFIQGVAGAKFRCMLCSKLFRGPEFVKMHLEAKHKEEAKRIMQDKYFDCDVSREDAMPIHHAMGTGCENKMPAVVKAGKRCDATPQSDAIAPKQRDRDPAIPAWQCERVRNGVQRLRSRKSGGLTRAGKRHVDCKSDQLIRLRRKWKVRFGCKQNRVAHEREAQQRHDPWCPRRIEIAGTLLVLGSICFNCFGALLAENFLKGTGALYEQKAQLLLGEVLVNSLLVFVAPLCIMDPEVRAVHSPWERGFFSGWDRRVLICAVLWIPAGWSATFLVKRCSTLMKTTAQASSSVLTYIFSVVPLSSGPSTWMHLVTLIGPPLMPEPVSSPVVLIALSIMIS